MILQYAIAHTENAENFIRTLNSAISFIPSQYRKQNSGVQVTMCMVITFEHCFLHCLTHHTLSITCRIHSIAIIKATIAMIIAVTVIRGFASLFNFLLPWTWLKLPDMF